MKSKRIKAIIAGIALAVCLAVASVFGGCSVRNGRDGVNGKDLNIFDIFEAAKEQTGNHDMTFEEFLKEYFSYTSGELEEATSLKAAINKSLMSAVSVRADFTYANSSSKFANNGSGVIVDVDRARGDMWVVTNCHVVYNASASGDKFSDAIYLWLYGSEMADEQANEANGIPAQIVGASKNYDLALLKVTASDLVKRSKAEKAWWSRAEENYLGETVYAVGNANGNTLSANVGYISKDLEAVSVDIGDSAKYTYNVMRTSATISAGNSGGGLFNGSGELVGIVNARGAGDTAGVGYAIPASTARRIINRMMTDSSGAEKHYVRLLKCGIEAYIADSYSTGLNDKGFAEIYEQVTVRGVDFGPAFGKLETGDIITHVKIMQDDSVIEQLNINRLHNFTDILLSAEVGNTIQITVLRGGSNEEKVFTLNYSASDFAQVA